MTSSSTIVALDLETTGLDPDRHHIWEIGAIVRDHRDPSLDGEWHWLLRPNLAQAEPRALQISRYYERAWPVQDPDRQGYALRLPAEHGKPHTNWTRMAVARRLAELLDSANLVGINPAFDAGFLGRFLRSHWQTPTWHYHLVDVGALTLGYTAALSQALGRPAPALPWRIDDLATQLGVPVDPAARHTAMGDARFALALYDKIMTATAADAPGALA
ncbi:3'-5' exonuclease [Micromonospora humidisoli]|uniref:3'-5' exonuclease n=1 Tax=Micromonospora humidisoli TaxID=2807622 RepID=A0ABS2JC15_9ACTN|nr:3'-5' exonuclease [Micromonospora humidisoli]MBM7083620.1 3'-5' exonuclease [Micromonospora humidisoli]